MTRSSRSRLLVIGSLLAVPTFLSACGGGGGGNSDTAATTPSNPCKSICGEPTPLPLTATVPSARWELGSLRFDVYGQYSVGVSADRTVAGLSHAEFYIDGQLVDTKSLERPSTNAGRESVFHEWRTGTFADGYHVLQARVFTKDGGIDELPATVVKVLNNRNFPVAMSPLEVAPQSPNSLASGTGQINLNAATGAVTGFVSFLNMTATSVHIHDADPLDSGSMLISLEYDGTTNRWNVPSGATVRATGATPTDAFRMMYARFYIDAHSVTFPDGEVRRQLMLPSGRLSIGTLQDQGPGTQKSATIVTITDPIMNLFRFDFYQTSEDPVTSPTVYYSPRVGAFDWQILLPKSPSRWWISNGYPFEPEEYNRSELFISGYPLRTPASPLYSPVPKVTLDPIPTFAELQTSIFTPKCSSCHNGVGSSLPGSMNLTVGNARASLLAVTSTQRSNLKRVDGSKWAASYLLHKLAGASSIAGARMPLGGPYLTEAEMARIEMWYEYGRPN